MNITRWVLGHFGVRDALVDDLVDEVRIGEGTQWRRAVLVWGKGQRDTFLATAAMAALYRLMLDVRQRQRRNHAARGPRSQRSDRPSGCPVRRCTSSRPRHCSSV